MIILKYYAISLLPALLWAIWMTIEDLRCKYGYSVPDSKFGYNWKPLRAWDQSLSMVALAALLIPIVNVGVVLWMLAGLLILAFAKGSK